MAGKPKGPSGNGSGEAPLLDLPPGYALKRDGEGKWDVAPSEGADLTDPEVLGTLSDLRAELELALSGGRPDRGAGDGDGQAQQFMPDLVPEDFRPWEQLDQRWVLDCLHRNVTGDAELYAELHKGLVAINATTGGDRKTPETLVFTGHHWALDEAGACAHQFVENVALAYNHAHLVLDKSRILADIETVKEKNAEKDDKEIKAMVAPLEIELSTKTKQVRGRMSSLRSPARENQVLTKAASVKGYPLNCRSGWLDAHPMLLPVANGVIDLETGKHRPGLPQDWMVRAAPVEWRGANFNREPFERFLREVYADPENGEPYEDLISFIQRLLGYAMVGSTPLHVLPIFMGRGRNGKSTLLNIMYAVLGPLAGSIPSELLLDQGVSRSADQPTPSIMSLKGMRLVWASETAEGRRISTERVKWMTGGDLLTGRHPNDKYPTTFPPTHLMLLLTNNLPAAPANDYAFWERVLAIPHGMSFVSRDPKQSFERRADPNRMRAIMRCLPGVLAWLVEGCIAFKKHGLNAPPIVTNATAAYQEGEDDLGDFLLECCDLGDKLQGGSTELYTVFEKWWAKRVGRFVPSHKKFGKWLADRGFEKFKSGGIHYRGVGLKSFLPEDIKLD